MKLIIFIIFVSLSLFTSCSNDSDDASPTGTSNQPPVIQGIYAESDTVGRGQYCDLECVATDADGDSLTYSWWATSGTIISYGGERTAYWVAPNVDGQYWVGVIVNDGRAVDLDSVQLTVVPPNYPPAIPYDPQPTHGSLNNPTSLTLSWSCFDPDGDQIVYDFYFGGSPSTSLMQRDLVVAQFSLEDLNSGSWYYWKIVARDDHGNTRTGDTWNFKTQ